MDNEKRNPGKTQRAATPANAKAPPRERVDPAESTPESPAVDRWEGEGGPVAESDQRGVAAGTGSVPTEPPPDYKDRWLRAEADLQNFRRRAARERDEARRAAEESVLLEIVAALDDLDRALDSARASGAPGAWLEGVTLVAQRLHESLVRRGVTMEDPLGQPFDPTFHEAMLEVDASPGTKAGTVVQVSHKGYRRGERALRPARVVVARTPAGSST